MYTKPMAQWLTCVISATEKVKMFQKHKPACAKWPKSGKFSGLRGCTAVRSCEPLLGIVVGTGVIATNETGLAL